MMVYDVTFFAHYVMGFARVRIKPFACLHGLISVFNRCFEVILFFRDRLRVMKSSTLCKGAKYWPVPQRLAPCPSPCCETAADCRAYFAFLQKLSMSWAPWWQMDRLVMSALSNNLLHYQHSKKGFHSHSTSHVRNRDIFYDPELMSSNPCFTFSRPSVYHLVLTPWINSSAFSR